MSPAPLRGDLTQGSVAQHLISLTIPMFLGISSMLVASMLETIYIGWIGMRELAAVSFGFPLIMGLSSMSMGVGTGASSIIARIVGGGDSAAVLRLSTHALLLVVLLSLALTLFGLAYADRIFQLLGASDDVIPLAAGYIRVWLYGLPTFAVGMVAGNIMRAAGNARTPGIIMVGGSALQVLFAPGLIFGIPGLWEGLGLVGAAWSFVLARGLALLYTLWVIVRMHLLGRTDMAVHAVLESWREVMRIGVPSMLSSLIGPVSMGILISLLARHGAEVVAGFGVASRIEMLVNMILMSLAGSVAPMVGQNWGAGRFERIFEAVKISCRFSLLWSAIAFAFLSLSGGFIVGLVNDDPLVVTAGAWYLLVVPLSYGFLGVSMVAGSCFTALGKPIPSLVMTLLRMLVLYLPLALLGDYLLGYQGIFGATALANVMIGLIGWRWVQSWLNDVTSR